MRDERHPVGGQEVHRVHEHDPEPDRERERRDEAMTVALVKNGFCLLVDKIDQDLDEGLAAIRHPGSGAAHHPPEKADAEQTQQKRHHERVDIQRPEAALADWLLEETQMVLDVLRGGERFTCGHRLDCVSSRGQKTPWRISAS